MSASSNVAFNRWTDIHVLTRIERHLFLSILHEQIIALLSLQLSPFVDTVLALVKKYVQHSGRTGQIEKDPLLSSVYKQLSAFSFLEL
jgi:hypothetical protein